MNFSSDAIANFEGLLDVNQNFADGGKDIARCAAELCGDSLNKPEIPLSESAAGFILPARNHIRRRERAATVLIRDFAADEAIGIRRIIGSVALEMIDRLRFRRIDAAAILHPVDV